MARLNLPTVTLCAATSVNVEATIGALRLCLEQMVVAECLLFTDAEVASPHPTIRIVPIAPLPSAHAYSNFVLNDLADQVTTSHCLIIQWDGFVIDADRWDDRFLEFDYIGAPWPQFRDGCDVGNGGFSLRSRKLLDACRDPAFRGAHPEDLAICRTNRRFLEARHGIRFADRDLADRFAFERGTPRDTTFGFHGVFNMARILGADRTWEVYCSLDDRRTALVDYWLLLRQMGTGRQALRRRARLTLDRLSNLLRS